jgi:2',3'-cyclic-nucleotide 2'-phosphodiesterase (5'-nucleotidase family)
MADSDAGGIPLHIIHTNDFHSRLTAGGVTRLREVIAGLNGAPYLLLDAGDAVKAGNVGVNPFGEPILDTMSDLGYHAMTMGNREFHVWSAALTKKIDRARFPILCANVRPRVEGASLPVQPNATFEVGGLTIAVFGVTVPMVTERMKVAALSSFVFDDPIAVAKKQVAELRYGADVLIALTHIGIREDERLARDISGIDLIIGGHSHVVLPEPQVVNGTPIVQGGCHGKWYGHLTLTVSRADKPTVEGRLYPLQRD